MSFMGVSGVPDKFVIATKSFMAVLAFVFFMTQESHGLLKNADGYKDGSEKEKAGAVLSIDCALSLKRLRRPDRRSDQKPAESTREMQLDLCFALTGIRTAYYLKGRHGSILDFLLHTSQVDSDIH